MRASDHVLTMGKGGDAGSWIQDKTENRGYGTSALNTPISFDRSTQIGIEGGNLVLPVLDITEGYYTMPGEVLNSCFKGQQCMGTTSRRYAATFYKQWGFDGPGDLLKLFQDSSTSFGAWNLKDMMLRKNIGEVLWERQKSGKFNTDKELGDFVNILEGGDMVTLIRRDKSVKSMEDNPHFKEEKGVTHVGMVVGQTSDGTPIIEHSYLVRGGRHVTRRERLDEMKDYLPSSILRPGNVPERKYTKTNLSTPKLGDIAKSNEDRTLPINTLLDLNRLGIFDEAVKPFNLLQLSDGETAAALEAFLEDVEVEDDGPRVNVVQLRERERLAAKVLREEKREANKVMAIQNEMGEENTSTDNMGGLIYKK